MAPQKIVLMICTMTDDKTKQKAMLAAADIHGVVSIAADVKNQFLTVIGNIDAVAMVKKIEKIGKVTIASIGTTEIKPEKKEEKKDQEKKKEEGKKEEKKQ